MCKFEDAKTVRSLVLFALGLVAMVAMVGLILDGGGAFAQRRQEQNAADLAAMAGAVVQINGGNDAAVIAKAQEVTKANKYDDAAADIVVTVTPSPGTVKVDILAPHQNAFAGVVGMPKWDVSATATAVVGVPTQAYGAAPIIFSDQNFDTLTGVPLAPYGCATPPTCTPFGFGEGNGDVPNNAGDIAWTLYGPNVNTNSVRPYLAGLNLTNPSFTVGDYIGQSNQGFHGALFGKGDGINDPSQCDGGSAHTNVDTCLSGKDIIVPIVSQAGSGACSPPHEDQDGGCFEGWALFHVVSADGGSDKTVKGYFVSGFSRGGGLRWHLRCQYDDVQVPRALLPEVGQLSDGITRG